MSQNTATHPNLKYILLILEMEYVSLLVFKFAEQLVRMLRIIGISHSRLNLKLPMSEKKTTRHRIN